MEGTHLEASCNTHLTQKCISMKLCINKNRLCKFSQHNLCAWNDILLGYSILKMHICSIWTHHRCHIILTTYIKVKIHLYILYKRRVWINIYIFFNELMQKQCVNFSSMQWMNDTAVICSKWSNSFNALWTK